MKKLLRLKTMLLLCALVAGSGSVWAESIEINTTNSGVTGSYQDKEFEVNDITFKFTQWMKNNNIQAKKSTTNSCYNIDAIPGTITSIVVVQTGTARAITIYGGTSEKPTNKITSPSTAATMTFDFTGNDYNYFSLNTPGNACYFDKITINYTPSEDPADTRTATTVEIDASGITNTNKYTGTSAGELAAIVKAGETTVGNSVTWSGNNDEVATIDASTGAVTLVAAGTVTFTASYAGDDDYKPSTSTYELTVTNDNPNAITVWSEDFSGYSANDVPKDGDYSYVCTDGGSATKIYNETLAGGIAPELLVSKTNGVFQATIPLHNVDGEMTLTFKTNNTNLVVSSTTTGVSLSGDTHAIGGTSTVTISDIAADMTSLVLVFTNSYSSNCRLDDIVLKGSLTTPVTVSSAGYATFASAYPVDYSDVDGLTAYTASTDGDKVSFSAAGKVPAENGVLIKAAAGTYDVPVVATASAVTNEFVGVTEDTAVDESIYVLYNGTKGVGFYRTTAASFTVGAYTAYLPADVVTEARAFIWFDEEGETTGIQNFEGSKMNFEGYYNLNGQKVVNPTKGMYIANGKKVIVK